MVGWILDRVGDALRGRKKTKTQPSHSLASFKPTWRKHRGQGLDAWFRITLLRWRDTRALLTLLTAAVIADLQAHDNEGAVLNALMFRSRTLRKLDLDERDALVKTVRADLAIEDTEGVPLTKRQAERINDLRWKAIEKASRSFRVSQERRLSVFLQILDILHADQELVTAEIQFRDELQALLGLSNADAASCIQLIHDKNAF